MRDVLADIQSGAFARQWVGEIESGGARFAELREQDRNHPIEQVGAALRAKMPFVSPVEVKAGQAQASASQPATAGDAKR
jgi:ketol-acid reductoisomerase